MIRPPESKLNHHRLCPPSYGECSSYEKIQRLARKGYQGYTVASASEGELRKIRQWARDKSKYVYVSKNDYFQDEELYENSCICIWMPEEYFDDCVNFINDLEKQAKKRIHYLTFDGEMLSEANLKEIKREYNKVKYRKNVRLVRSASWEENFILEFDDDPYFMSWKLKWI